jgi:Myb-like DNA-binding domain
MNGFIEPLPGLLDDPQVQSTDLPKLTDFHIAPLRNPAPSRHCNVPSPVEPLAENAAPARVKTRDNTQDPGREARKRTPKITPSDVILARDAKKPNLTIRELVEASTVTQFEPTYLPSFVSLAVVERSPVQPSQALDLERAQKRLRLDTGTENASGEDYRRLPRPEQNDTKSAARPLPLLPAMVAGLHEPPQSAALLPSMDPESLSNINTETVAVTKMKVKTVLEAAEIKSHSLPPELMLNTPEIDNAILPEVNDSQADEAHDEDASTSERISTNKDGVTKASRRTPRKWTDLETEQLMTGVKKYGIGKWKQILTDPAFNFSVRSAVDLKDRFRVCQPEEYKNRKTQRTKKADLPLGQSSPSSTNIRPVPLSHPTVKDLPVEESSGGILATSQCPKEAEDQLTVKVPSAIAYSGEPSSSSPHPGKRRKRRPWSQIEDAALMKGVAKHGFQWTMIHDDPELNLSHRKATDLRDRIRNKYPDGYKHAETAPLRSAEKRKKHSVMKSGTDGVKPNGVDGAPTKASTRRGKQTQKEGTKPSQSGADATQDHSGLKLPPLTLDVGDWDWENNTLPPLLDWEDIGI